MEKAWFKHWPKGLKTNLNYPKVPSYKIIESSAKNMGDITGLIFYDKQYNYKELYQMSRKFATALQNLGVKKGDCIAIDSLNCPPAYIAYYGIILAGAVYSPTSPLLKEDELIYELNNSDTKTIIVLDQFYPMVKRVNDRTRLEHVIVVKAEDYFPEDFEILPGFKIKPVDIDGTLNFTKLLNTKDNLVEMEIDPEEDLAHILYTSGTTGKPKGVMITHHNVVASSLQIGQWLAGVEIEYRNDTFVLAEKSLAEVAPGEHWEWHGSKGRKNIVLAPWWGSMGIMTQLNILTLTGTTMVILPRLNLTEYIKVAAEQQVDAIVGVPTLFMNLLNHADINKHDFSCIKVVGSGGAPLPIEMVQKLKKYFPDAIFLEAYGMTEASGGTTYNPVNWRGLRKIGSVGIPLPDTEVKIVDMDTGKREMPAGKDGEVIVRGPQVTKGYWKDEQKTKEIFREGWLYTGDIGRVDEDGYLYIVGRKKEILIYKGYNISPVELEQVLYQHPTIRQCAVIGKKHPSVGEIPMAFVSLRERQSATEDELLEFVNSRVAAYKKIRGIRIIDDLPLSPSGKIAKKELEKML